MRSFFTILAISLVLTVSVDDVYGQSLKDAISIKKMFVDYKSVYDGDVLDFQKWNSGFEVGYQRLLTDQITVALPVRVASVRQTGALVNTTIVGLEGQVHYHFLKETKLWNPYLGAGIGLVTENFDDSHAEIPTLLGVNLMLGARTDMNFEASYRIGLEDEKDNLGFALGFVHRLGKLPEEKPEMEPPVVEPEVVADADEDGIPDEEDLCPQVPGPKEFLGCPDSDGDGLEDGKDDCPNEAGPIELRGCPDSDGDGVSDTEDECPNMAGTVENKGCPVMDSDGDGIADKDDRCPDRPGILAFGGCPDSDGDGISDDVDRCPEIPGGRLMEGCPDSDGDGLNDLDDRCPEIVGPVNNKGCPELKKEEKAILEFAVQNVEFQVGKATLKIQSFSILDQIADILKRYPGYDLRIGGHTDWTGDATSNQILSERRARSCYEYLSSKGISTRRMSYVGYGEAKPVADNNTFNGRQRNRRVEFDLYLE